MYVIIVYDVEIKRINKIRNFLRQYLYWVQNSVFEGEITKSELVKIKDFLNKNCKKTDSIVIYVLESFSSLKSRIQLGIKKDFANNIII